MNAKWADLQTLASAFLEAKKLYKEATAELEALEAPQYPADFRNEDEYNAYVAEQAEYEREFAWREGYRNSRAQYVHELETKLCGNLLDGIAYHFPAGTVVSKFYNGRRRIIAWEDEDGEKNKTDLS